MTTPPLIGPDLAFDDVRLPADIETGAQIGPSFQTTIIALTSGREQRNADWSQELLKADIGYGMMYDVATGEMLSPDLAESAFKDIMSFFRARRGQWRGFRFKDWTDYQADQELLGVGPGTDFQLIRNYGSYRRRITRPVADSIEVFVGGVSSPFTVGELGMIHLNTPAALNEFVTASFEFDVPVRFASDVSQVQLTWARAGTVPSIALIGIRE